MAWTTSDRRDDLPANWKTLRERRFKMDGFRCTATNVYGERCDEPAEECDHIGSRTDHRLVALRSLCHWHHAKKTSNESRQARDQKRKEIDSRFRRTETHPGSM